MTVGHGTNCPEGWVRTNRDWVQIVHWVRTSTKQLDTVSSCSLLAASCLFSSLPPYPAPLNYFFFFFYSTGSGQCDLYAKASCCGVGFHSNRPSTYLPYLRSGGHSSGAQSLCIAGQTLDINPPTTILVPRGRDPSGQRRGSRPLAASKTGSPRFTDSLSNMKNLIG